VTLHSGHGATHYDLMLERGESLVTWRLGRAPTVLAPGEALPAEALPDHRRAYLTYEGPVSGGRGEVTRLDGGTYRTVSRDERRWVVALAGRRVRGRFELRCEGDAGWLLRRLSRPRPPRSRPAGREA